MEASQTQQIVIEERLSKDDINKFHFNIDKQFHNQLNLRVIRELLRSLKLYVSTTKYRDIYKYNSICKVGNNRYIFIAPDGIEYDPIILGYTDNDYETAIYSILSAMKYYNINSFGNLYEFPDDKIKKNNNYLTMLNIMNYLLSECIFDNVIYDLYDKGKTIRFGTNVPSSKSYEIIEKIRKLIFHTLNN